MAILQHDLTVRRAVTDQLISRTALLGYVGLKKEIYIYIYIIYSIYPNFDRIWMVNDGNTPRDAQSFLGSMGRLRNC